MLGQVSPDGAGSAASPGNPADRPIDLVAESIFGHRIRGGRLVDAELESEGALKLGQVVG